MSKNKQEKQLDELSRGTAPLGLDDLMILLNSPKRLGMLRLYSGFMSGIGITIGAAVVIVILGFAVKLLGGVPWIGDLIQQIGDAAKN